jgi:acetylornithine deacetylase/succinyl-diaminopimelate desuccinylase-like protein
MTIAPFAAEIKNGRLYGRGAGDAKSGLAAIMMAMKTLKSSGVVLNGSVRFVSEVGEEGGGWSAEQIESSGFMDADMAVIGEQTELRVEIGNRGVFRNSVKVFGRATHSGLAQRGINAIQKMAKVILGLYALPYLEIDDPIWGKSSMNVQKIEGGRYSASVPDECTISIDSRLTAKVPPKLEVFIFLSVSFDQTFLFKRKVWVAKEQIVQMLHSLADSDEEFRFELGAPGEGLVMIPAVSITEEEKIVVAAKEATRKILKREPTIAACSGYTMAARFIQRGIPSIILGPGSVEQAHSADEWVEIQQIVDAAKIYTLIALMMLDGLDLPIQAEQYAYLPSAQAGNII